MAIVFKKRKHNEVQCDSEYGTLRDVIVCVPQYMKIEQIINETQKYYAKENINMKRAMKQHREFVQVMKNEGVDVHHLQPMDAYPEQVFTRDIGFSIGDTVFISRMGSSIRSGEEKVLRSWLLEHQLNLSVIEGERIEGGDVVVHGKTIFVGLSGRTTEATASALRRHLPDMEIITIPIDPAYLHLDCVFNILSSEEALIYKPALSDTEIESLAKRFTLIEVEEDEQFTLGTNVLSLGEKKVLSLPMNKKVNECLRARGYKVLEVDISEIIKSGGSFRCCTMPFHRESPF